ncbi:zinc ribbon domain-containing protein [Olsenella urininfantis]|uniref:zinc ribbon domain-containing protein n=1 Tax=Olsenella urininfantis TaxID=1871033 RepID=UPI0009FB4A9B|nr:zinc ribbon domain-containing protein [Olsenella urininfantis]
MSLIFCPECHARISSSAVTCPHCGFVAQSEETGIVPISSLPPAKVAPRVTALEATVFDDGMNLIPTQTNESLVKFLADADTMAKFAPAIYDIIKKLSARGDTKYLADFSAAAEELMKSGELVFSVEKKTEDKWGIEELQACEEALVLLFKELWPYPDTSFRPQVKVAQTHYLSDEYDFTSSDIEAFTFLGSRFPVKTWKEAA